MRDPEFLDDRDFFPGEDGEEVVDRGPRRDIWQYLSRLMVVCLFLLVLAGILRIFWPEIERHRELSSEVARLETIRAAKLERVADLQRQSEWMLTDREYLESVARDRLDMAHANEVVVRIDRDSEARALEIRRERARRERELKEAERQVSAKGESDGVEVAAESLVSEIRAEQSESATHPHPGRPPLRATVVDLSGKQ